MDNQPKSTQPLVIDEAKEPRDGWDDPVRGRIHWRTLFSRGLTPTEGVTCGVAELKAGGWLGLHRHAPPEIYYVFAGEGLVTLEGKDIAVKAGSAVFIPGMAEHGIRQTGRRSCGGSTGFRSIRSTAWNICSPRRRDRRVRRLPAPPRRASGPRHLTRQSDDPTRMPMISGAMSVSAYAPAPGRECGGCAMCCKVYALPELAKPPGVWCKHCQPGKGCKIHDALPHPCREFFCLWMTDGNMPPEWRPDRARFVLSVYPKNGFVYGQVDPGSPGAWRKPPYYDRLRAMAKALLEQRRHLIMFIGDYATLVMPDETLPLGRMTAEDSFRIEQVFGPRGPTWRAAKV